jgi:hypothetical protein
VATIRLKAESSRLKAESPMERENRKEERECIIPLLLCQFNQYNQSITTPKRDGMMVTLKGSL